jgi:hypothetical protein
MFDTRSQDTRQDHGVNHERQSSRSRRVHRLLRSGRKCICREHSVLYDPIRVPCQRQHSDQWQQSMEYSVFPLAIHMSSHLRNRTRKELKALLLHSVMSIESTRRYPLVPMRCHREKYQLRNLSPSLSNQRYRYVPSSISHAIAYHNALKVIIVMFVCTGKIDLRIDPSISVITLAMRKKISRHILP